MGVIGNLILIELYVFGALTIIGVIAGLVQRSSEVVLPEMVMTRVSPDRAAMHVAQYLQSVEDYRFGFPTGRFDSAITDSGGVVAVERAAGTVGFSLMRVLVLIPVRIAAGIANAGCCLGAFIGFIIGIWLDLLVLPGVIIATIAEGILKRVLRSKITVDILAQADESVRLTFHLIGPCARLLRPSIVAAFTPSQVPERIMRMAVGPSYVADAA
jgi:hypothetical protein